MHTAKNWTLFLWTTLSFKITMSRRLICILLVLWLTGSVLLFFHTPNLPRPKLYTRHWYPLRPRVEFDLREFGGIGDGETDNTKAFESAVLAIKRSGGGKLLVADGVWLTAPFNLTSDMTLFLEKDAVILGIEDEQRWPLMPPLPSYGHGREKEGPRYGSLIHGQNLKNVVITGNNGTIDGQGKIWWKKFQSKFLKHTRGPLVQLMWSENILIFNITLRNSPFWTLHPYDCKNITISNVTILAPIKVAPNTDGIDPDSCEDMLIENCYIEVGDDCIAIKSGFDQYGIKYGRPSRNILIRNTTMRTVVSAGVSIGSEMSGGVSNITIENSLVWSSKRGVRIKTATGRGGYIRDIVYRNLTFDDCLLGMVIMTQYTEHADSDYDRRAIPVVENIKFSDIKGKNVRVPVQISGSKEIKIQNVDFKDVMVTVKATKYHPFQCAFVTGRVVGFVHPKPCVNLDKYDKEGNQVMKSDNFDANNVEDVR